MFERYGNRVREAMASRKLAELPRMRMTVIGLIVCTSGVILVAALDPPDGKPPEFHFTAENGMVTVFSAGFLFCAAAFSIGAASIVVRLGIEGRWTWLIMAAGFGFFALDELLQFHERAGYKLEKMIAVESFRKWNDLIVILYGLIAIPILVLVFPILAQRRLVLELFAVAFLCFVVHTAIDSLAEPPSTTSHIAEESSKLFSGAFLMLGSFVGFLGLVWQLQRVEK